MSVEDFQRAIAKVIETHFENAALEAFADTQNQEECEALYWLERAREELFDDEPAIGLLNEIRKLVGEDHLDSLVGHWLEIIRSWRAEAEEEKHYEYARVADGRRF